MSGSESRSGFAFQDLVLAERVLAHILARRAATIASSPSAGMTFGIEAAPEPGATPEWDIVQEVGNTLVLEEAKSGAVKAEDRWALWLRVRRTVNRLPDDGREIQIRLIVNANALPSNPEHWRTLATQSAVVAGVWFTPKDKDDRRKSVRKAADLANEALHVLTSSDADTESPPLTLARARSVLSRFALNDEHSADSVETAVLRHLSALSYAIGVNELLSTVRGELTRRAESADQRLRFFVGDDLLTSLAVLGRLARTEPESLRRWRELVTAAASNELELPGRDGGLAYQDWTAVQPAAAAVLAGARPVALLGNGGVGKTVALHSWLADRRNAGDETFLLAGTDLSGIDSEVFRKALDLGVFAARHRGCRFTIGVDAIENLADEKHRKSLLAALLGIATNDVRVCVTCRSLEWRSNTGSADGIRGWASCELAAWPEQLVREQANTSSRSRIAPDLLRLLRSPLLLDLFLRTFGRDAEIPAGLQTRHGLLEAYWDRRILPPNDERSVERRLVIAALADEEAQGRYAHTTTGDAARELTSEGLLTLRRGFRFFRHALLRDFAMRMWAVDVDFSAEVVIQRLEAIQPALVQHGALRAVLEGEATSPNGTLSILSQLRSPLLLQAGTVLGEFEDITHVNLASVVDAVHADDRSTFLRALLAGVKLDRNIAWAAVLLNLPDDAAWADATGWLTADVILLMTDAIDSIKEALVPDSAARSALAERLRRWSLAPRVFAEMSRGDGFAFGWLTRLLTKLDPSTATIAWIGRIADRGPRTRFWILCELPELVRVLVEEHQRLDDDVLRAIYCTTAGLRDDGGRLRDDANVPREGVTDYERFEAALIGESKSTGLIENYPSTFVRVAVDLIAGYEADEADERVEQEQRVAAILGARQWERNVPPEVLKLEEAACALTSEPLSKDVAGNELIVDSPIDPYWEIDGDYAHLLLHLRNLAEGSLASDGTFFDSWFWPSVARSRSALLRACVLDLLTRDGGPCRPTILDELLRDGRLYFLHCARPYLQRGIRSRWHSIPSSDREVIVNNITNTARRPAANEYWPGPLLAALPREEQPPPLRVFVELYTIRGWSLELEESRSTGVVSGLRAPEEREPDWVPIPGIAAAEQEPWQALSRWARGQIAQATDPDWLALVARVEVLVTRSLPAPESLVERADLIERLQEIAALHVSGDSARVLSARLSRSTLRQLAQWALDGLTTISAADVVGDCPPLEGTGTSIGLQSKAELWMAFAELGDTLLYDDDLSADDELSATLFVAIDDITKVPTPPRLAWNVLARIGGWFRRNVGKPVLWRLLAERVRDSRALSRGLRFLFAFERTEQQRLIRLWLTKNLTPPIAPQRAFARDIGQHVGCAALLRYPSGETTGSYELLREFVVEPTSEGLLSDASVHMYFVGQSVFGVKQALVSGGVPIARAAEFADRAANCWTVLAPLLREEHQADAPHFALWIFNPIFNHENQVAPKFTPTVEERVAWWTSLRSLALSVLRDGPSRELSSLFRTMKGSPTVLAIEEADVVDLVEGFQARTSGLTSSPGYHWDDAVSCASKVIDSVAGQTADARIRDRLYSCVASWAMPPFSNQTAAGVAKRLRG